MAPDLITGKKFYSQTFFKQYFRNGFGTAYFQQKGN
jgi:hypothetical protein